MFTGLVEEKGTVTAVEQLGDAVRLSIRGTVVTTDAAHGDSIAVNGCCLTVVAVGDDGIWEADAVAETLARTNLDAVTPGDLVNLERPVRPVDRLGGHVVQGHVDAVGEVVTPAPDLRVRIPPELTRYLVPKGSVTVDGCSLTVVDVLDDGFTVAVIPHTAAVTTLGVRKPGDRVNIEVDVLAKYTERLLADRIKRLLPERGT